MAEKRKMFYQNDPEVSYRDGKQVGKQAARYNCNKCIDFTGKSEAYERGYKQGFD